MLWPQPTSSKCCGCLSLTQSSNLGPTCKPTRCRPQETILHSDRVRDAARKRRDEREAAVTLEERVALNAANKEKAAELQRSKVRAAAHCIQDAHRRTNVSKDPA